MSRMLDCPLFSILIGNIYMSKSNNTWRTKYAITGALVLIFLCQSIYAQKQQVSLDDYISEYGGNYDLYFTIETTVVDSPYEAYAYSNELSAQIEKQFKEANQEIRLKRQLLNLKSRGESPVYAERNSVEKVIEDLKNLFPSLEISQNKHKSKIYHIKDKALPAKTILDMELDEFNFNGPMYDLYKVLNNSLDWELNLNSRRSASLVAQSNYTSTTSISTPIVIKKLDGLTVRDVLSIGFSLDGYKRVLWICTFDVEAEEIEVKPCGPLPVKNKENNTKDKGDSASANVAPKISRELSDPQNGPENLANKENGPDFLQSRPSMLFGFILVGIIFLLGVIFFKVKSKGS